MMDAEGTPTSSEREPLVTTTAEQAPAAAPQAFSKAPGTRVALVTGASSGIGEDTARKLQALGYIVYGAARRTDRLQALTADGIRPLAMDVTDDASMSAGVNRILEETGRIDVLVNNAGFGTGKDVADDAPERLEQEVRLNCLAVVGLTARYLPAMRERGSGTIINISSAAAFQPMPHMAVYGATKAFVLSFTEALWRETRRDGIRVLAVCPGSTDTPFFQVADEGTVVGRLRSTRQVLDTTMRALRGSGPSVVDGLGNAVVARFLTRVLPQRALLAAVDRVFRR